MNTNVDASIQRSEVPRSTKPTNPRSTRHRLRPVVACVVILATFGSACTNGDARPTEEAWMPMWAQRKAEIPDIEAIASGGRPLCDQLDTRFRVILPELLPAPSDALDDPVQEWTSQAVRLVFECPTDRTTIGERLETLDLLAAEIDGGIDFQGQILAQLAHGR